jgi:hypothetical protein
VCVRLTSPCTSPIQVKYVHGGGAVFSNTSIVLISIKKKSICCIKTAKGGAW